MSPAATLAGRGVVLVRGALRDAAVERWRRVATEWFGRVDELADTGGPWQVADELGVRFAPPACSLGIEVLDADDAVDTVSAAVGGLLGAVLGGPVRPLVESSWLRRQRPPALAPDWHVPHTWHQDGALGADFLHDTGTDELVPMVTVWCPLVDCGAEAPGIAYVPGRVDDLLRPEALCSDPGPAEAPVMRPGDALVMTGDLLHRTHVDQAMTRERTSVEIRFVPADHPGRRGPWSGRAAP